MAVAPTSSVRVGVRIRPLAPKEAAEGGTSVVVANPLDRTVSICKRKFTYDAVFHEAISQPDLYGDLAPPLLEAFLGGYNATVLAYGQTGSGKTFTMGSEARAESTSRVEGEEGGALDEGDGLIPRFMADIFANLSRRKEESERAALSSPKNDSSDVVGGDSLVDFTLSASFLEVYGEDIHDLLDESRASLPIREGAGGEVIVKGLKNVAIKNDAEAMEVLNTGKLHRTTAATLMNCTSSRSHAIFTVSLRQTTRGADGVDNVETSRFSFVDLAGSERMKKTGAQGERAREGIKINEGLLALGNVINALADEERLAKGEKVHVPYRESKLTRLLTDALGGNSQTLFMACVSPSDTNASETLSTLQYANRARNIRNAPTRNVDATALELQRLRALNNLLKCELIKQRFAGVDSDKKTSGDDDKADTIGVVSEELLKREDVVAYMNRIDEKSAEMSGAATEFIMPRPHSAPLNTSGLRLSVLPPMSTTSGQRTDNIRGRQSLQVGSATARLSSSVAAIAASSSNSDDPGKDQLILDVNPEEDLQIIDQLLELQQHDQRFEKEQSDDQDRLDDVEGEIEAQESRLLQLREHLKAYHSMKSEYEQLLREVHGLESEKMALAKELERAQADPTRGCSRAIKGKLQKIEASLARARSETRRHQQMYRQAEAEAQKGRVLERKILDLKHTKVSLLRKQKEDAAKHREFTNQKSREIQALKRKERNADRKMSKMETEAQKYRMGLERSRAQCDKLSDKLKQTESHLMKLLARRRNESKSVRQSTRMSRRHAVEPRQQSSDGAEHFAPDEEVKSIEFLLEKTVTDRVAASKNRDAYESKLLEHGRLMRAMAKEAKSIRKLRSECQGAESNASDEIAGKIREHEDTVEALQLKIELVEGDLEQLRAKCPSIEAGDDAKEEDGPALKMLSKLDGPVLRTLLWNLLDSYATTEIQRRTLKEALGRKDSTLKSLEGEMNLQSEQIGALTESLERYRKLVADDGPDPVDVIRALEEDVKAANVELETCQADKNELHSKLEEARDTISSCQRERAQAEERLALFRSHQKLTESTEETERVLTQLHGIMAAIGMSMEDRESVRTQLENCIEDACSRMLEEASSLRDEKTQQINDKKERLAQMRSALGLDQSANDGQTSPQPLNAQLESLDRQLREIQPQYDSALERCQALARNAEALTSDLQPIGDDLRDNLQRLMKHQKHGAKRKRASHIPEHHRASMEASREARAKLLFKNVEGMLKGLQTIDEGSSLGADDISVGPSALHPHTKNSPTEPGYLSAAFLDSCEQDIKRLRLLKSERLLSNDDKCRQINAITKRMHVTSGELSSIVLHGLKKSRQGIVAWWDEGVAGAVYSVLSKKGSATLVSGSFSDHLNLVLETLQRVSQGRQLLSDTLAEAIKESHSALLATAEGCGMDTNALSRSLHDALSHLPSLSKEYVTASVEEMEMLVTAAESVSQSEIETLTVLWEGLGVRSSERGQFWGDLDQLTSKLEMSSSSPFDKVLEDCPAEVEEWVLKSLTDATRVQRTLGIRVFKLKKIHKEVERLKRKQDAKNGIMTLNNELKVLDAQLADFEEEANNKQRLMNKKVNSSSLLEEERFRKQMQGTFSAKLNTLRKLLNDWEANEGPIDDSDMLSEVVRSMLENSHRMDAWMSEKTRLMHLRTTRNASSASRTACKPRDTAGSRPLSGPGRTARAGAPSASRPNAHIISKRPSSISTDGRPAARNSAHPTKTAAPGGHRSRPPSPTPRPKMNGASASGEHPKRKALSSSTHNAPPPEKATKNSPVDVHGNESQVMCPFGDLLADTPTHKENR